MSLVLVKFASRLVIATLVVIIADCTLGKKTMRECITLANGFLILTSSILIMTNINMVYALMIIAVAYYIGSILDKKN